MFELVPVQKRTERRLRPSAWPLWRPLCIKRRRESPRVAPGLFFSTPAHFPETKIARADVLLTRTVPECRLARDQD